MTSIATPRLALAQRIWREQRHSNDLGGEIIQGLKETDFQLYQVHNVASGADLVKRELKQIAKQDEKSPPAAKVKRVEFKILKEFKGVRITRSVRENAAVDRVFQSFSENDHRIRHLVPVPAEDSSPPQILGFARHSVFLVNPGTLQPEKLIVTMPTVGIESVALAGYEAGVLSVWLACRENIYRATFSCAQKGGIFECLETKEKKTNADWQLMSCHHCPMNYQDITFADQEKHARLSRSIVMQLVTEPSDPHRRLWALVQFDPIDLENRGGSSYLRDRSIVCLRPRGTPTTLELDFELLANVSNNVRCFALIPGQHKEPCLLFSCTPSPSPLHSNNSVYRVRISEDRKALFTRLRLPTDVASLEAIVALSPDRFVYRKSRSQLLHVLDLLENGGSVCAWVLTAAASDLMLTVTGEGSVGRMLYDAARERLLLMQSTGGQVLEVPLYSEAAGLNALWSMVGGELRAPPADRWVQPRANFVSRGSLAKEGPCRPDATCVGPWLSMKLTYSEREYLFWRRYWFYFFCKQPLLQEQVRQQDLRAAILEAHPDVAKSPAAV